MSNSYYLYTSKMIVKIKPAQVQPQNQLLLINPDPYILLFTQL